MFDLDRWLKRLWLVNGVLLLVLLVIATGSVIVGWVAGAFSRDEAVVATDTTRVAKTQPRAIRFTPPRDIWGTKTRLVVVYYGREPQARVFGLSGSYSEYFDGDRTPTVNVAFLDENGQRGRLLLDRPGYIRHFDYPDSKEDSLQRWITYRMALDDTNGDGRLDADDHDDLYVTDLNGINLRRVLPPGMRFLDADPVGDGRHLVVTALEVPKDWRGSDDELPQRAFLYDVRASVLTPHAALDSLALKAARLLGRP